MLFIVEEGRYINPEAVGYVESAQGTGSKAIIQGKEITFSISASELCKIINECKRTPNYRRAEERGQP